MQCSTRQSRALRSKACIKHTHAHGLVKLIACGRDATGTSSLNCCSYAKLTEKNRATVPRIGLNTCASSQVTQETETHAFDLSLGVLLAGAAFEAYLVPQGSGHYGDTSINGTKITYTEKNFLHERYQGILKAELVKGTNLRAADFTGRSDPYAVLSVGSSSGTSKFVFQNLNPVWNETFFLYVKDLENDALKIRLYDKDLLSSDDDLGMALLPLSDMKDSQGKQKTFDLQLRGQGAGEGVVQVRLTFLPLSDDTFNVLPSAAKYINDLASNLGGQIPDVSSLANQVFDTLESVKSNLEAQHLAFRIREDTDLSKVDNAWRSLSTMAGKRGNEVFAPVAYVESDETDTQVWLYRNVRLRQAVIAFRGTEQVKWKDLATDLNLIPCSLNPERVDEDGGLPLPFQLIKGMMSGSEQIMVHKGFLSAYDSVRFQVVSLLDSITGDGDKGDWTVYVTGHSLGGALATLCAYELAARHSTARTHQRIVNYTFGSPRVGNRAFAEAYSALVPDTWRVTNSNDIVTSVPRLMNYCHVPHAVRLAGDGTVTVHSGVGAATDVFGEGKSHVEVINELVNRVNVGGVSLDQVYEEIKEREMELFSTLVNGQGLEEHMETYYLTSLKMCVLAMMKNGANVKKFGWF